MQNGLSWGSSHMIALRFLDLRHAWREAVFCDCGSRSLKIFYHKLCRSFLSFYRHFRALLIVGIPYYVPCNLHSCSLRKIHICRLFWLASDRRNISSGQTFQCIEADNWPFTIQKFRHLDRNSALPHGLKSSSLQLNFSCFFFLAFWNRSKLLSRLSSSRNLQEMQMLFRGRLSCHLLTSRWCSFLVYPWWTPLLFDSARREISILYYHYKF